MNSDEIRIEELEMMRAAYTRAVSKKPEEDAWKTLKSWTEPRGLLSEEGSFRLFGRNNPSPSGPDQEYGYEFFLTVGPEVVPEGKIEIREIKACLCAVLRFKGIEHITEMWHRLIEWIQKSEYDFAGHEEPYGYEELLNPLEKSTSEWMFDLWAPIRK